MKEEYDLTKMKRRKNPYANDLKKQITIRLDEETIKYFKELALETGLPYQNLINLYLRDCADQHRKLSMKWASQKPHPTAFVCVRLCASVAKKKNLNKHTEYGLQMLEKSMGEVGFIGAMTAANDGEIFDGSARIEKSAVIFDDVDPIVIETDGTRPVIIKRTHLA